jgi:hypothetical protein
MLKWRGEKNSPPLSKTPLVTTNNPLVRYWRDLGFPVARLLPSERLKD